MKAHRTVRGIAIAGLMALSVPQPVFAELQIDLVPVVIDNQPPPAFLAGGGNLRDIMKVAAEAWERVFAKRGDKWKVTIQYGWDDLGNGFGKEELQEQGGKPNRITRALVKFNNSLAVSASHKGYFADPTPRDNSEYERYTSNLIFRQGGWLNVGRLLSDATGEASERIDLLTVAMHEIGHALGLDGEYRGFIAQEASRRQITIRPPRPFAGTTIMITFGPHIDGLSDALMIFDPIPGARQFISAADALVIAQLSSFGHPNLADPSLDQKNDEDEQD